MSEKAEPQAAEIVAAIQERQGEPAAHIKCHRILVPTDGSGTAFKAVGQAIQLAEATGAELTLLMVVDYNRNVAAFEQVSLSGYVPAELKIAAYQFLADLMHVVPRHVRAHTRVEAGDPAETVLDVAEQEESDLIVMGTRGFGTFRRLLLGSVSSQVLAQAHCPVLLVKGMPEGWADEDNFLPEWGK